jgi:DNA-binding CsgD family transcriptional regulator
MNANADTPPDWRIVLELLRRLGFGGIVVDSHHRVIAQNSVAARRFREWNRMVPRDVRKTVESLVKAAGGVDWIARDRGGRLIITAVPASPALASHHTLLILLDPKGRCHVDEAALREIFRLTPAEARLAHTFASGERPQAIAHARGVGLGTIRTQLRSIFAKTRTSGQVELGLLLARFAVVQPSGQWVEPSSQSRKAAM